MDNELIPILDIIDRYDELVHKKVNFIVPVVDRTNPRVFLVRLIYI